jgi:RNA polymerase sigma-70 factor, ECF subfamily
LPSGAIGLERAEEFFTKEKSFMRAVQNREPERELLNQVFAGNAEAFSELVQPHWSTVYGISLRILKNHEDAEDNVQSVFCKAYRKIRQFHGDSKVSTWLYRIAVNEALMELRKRQSARVFAPSELATAESEENAALEREDPQPSPERRCIASDLATKALRGFEPGLREIFVLNKTEGWTHRELAKSYGTTAQIVKSRLFRVRAKLQQRMMALSEKPPVATEA